MDLAKNPKLLRWVVLGVALLVGLVAWLVTRDGDDEEPAPAPVATEARIVSEEELADVATVAGHPVYWAGPIPDTELEVTEDEEGVRVRYLEEGAEVGNEEVDFLTVGSYPLPDPAKSLEEFGEREGAIVNTGPDGRKLVASEEKESNVYFVSPDNSVQVEVFDPDPERAMEIAESGQVQPVG